MICLDSNETEVKQVNQADRKKLAQHNGRIIQLKHLLADVLTDDQYEWRISEGVPALCSLILDLATDTDEQTVELTIATMVNIISGLELMLPSLGDEDDEDDYEEDDGEVVAHAPIYVLPTKGVH